MKYFGNYLLEKKLISPENLLKAHFQQIESQPPMPRLALELKILSAEQILKVIQHQTETSMDFAAAAITTGCLNEKNKQLLEKEMKAKQTPLSMILLNSGYLSAKELVQSIDEFISQAQAPSAASSSNISNLSANNQSGTPTQTKLSFFPIEKELAHQIEAALSKEKVEEMINVLHLVKQNAAMPDLVHTFLEDIHKNIIAAQKLAQSAKAILLEQILNQTAHRLERVISGAQTSPEHLSQMVIPAVEEALHLCREMSEIIINKNTEEDFWRKTETRTRYEAIAEKLTA